MKTFLAQAVWFITGVLAVRSLAAAVALAPATPEPALTATNVSGPRIEFDSQEYNFGKALEGTVLKHDFVFTNTGDAVLEITGVHPSCGCTTAGDWSRQVEPGNTGTIPVQFNSGRFNGTIWKTVTVVSNDKQHPTIQLQIRGTLWRPIEVNPQTAILNVVADSPVPVTNVVRIVSSLEQPLTLSSPESNNRTFTAELQTVQPGKEFQLSIATVPPLKLGTVRGVISIKTSATNVPTLNITTLAVVQPALVVSPSQITLPPGAVSNAMSRVVLIRNNDASPLTLSEPTVNAEGVDVQIKELAPGRQFTVMLVFPAGFELSRERDVDLSIKTTNPRYPVIKVPVRPVTPPVPHAMQRHELPATATSPAVLAVPTGDQRQR